MSIEEILRQAVEKKASDIFLIPGLPMSYKINGVIEKQSGQKLLPNDTEELMHQIYKQAGNRDTSKLLDEGDDDFAFAVVGLSRFRANVFKQRGSLAAIIRVITFSIPDYRQLGIPQTIIDIGKQTKGFVLVTGPAGSGKSTTLACIIDAINHSRNAHVVTLEDPIEYLHYHDKSVVTQREIGIDTRDYASALRGALRQSPDVILVGEMRDYETIRTAMTAAETGHLVISTLHTIGAAKTIDRIIDAFPPEQQQQIRVQLSMVLNAVISQQLIPAVDDREVPAFEIMFLNNAIRNLIRESKVHQIDSVILSSSEEGMMTMDNSLAKLYRDGVISRENAIVYSSNEELMVKRLGR